jgi:hypothetical protein
VLYLAIVLCSGASSCTAGAQLHHSLRVFVDVIVDIYSTSRTVNNDNVKVCPRADMPFHKVELCPRDGDIGTGCLVSRAGDKAAGYCSRRRRFVHCSAPLPERCP